MRERAQVTLTSRSSRNSFDSRRRHTRTRYVSASISNERLNWPRFRGVVVVLADAHRWRRLLLQTAAAAWPAC